MLTAERKVESPKKTSAPHSPSKLELIRLWGGLASNAILDPSTQIFTTPGVTGLIGYKLESKAAVALGDPVCAPKDIPALVSAFHKYCSDLNLDIIYVTTTKSFTDWAMQHVTKSLVEYGAEVIIDPANDPKSHSGSNARVVRRKTRHAETEGVKIFEYHGNNPSLEEGMIAVSKAWLKGRSGPQIYLSDIDLFNDKTGKRWIYAAIDTKIIGVAELNRLESQNGWLLNHLMIIPKAPNGTPESLVMGCIEILRQEGCRYLSAGSVPGDSLGAIIGPSKLTTWFTRTIFKAIKIIFKLTGRIKFWEKYEPEFRPSYLLFTQDHIRFRDVWAIIRSMHLVK